MRVRAGEILAYVLPSSACKLYCLGYLAKWTPQTSCYVATRMTIIKHIIKVLVLKVALSGVRVC